MTFEEKTIHRETKFEGRIIDVHVHTVTLPNGEHSTREVVTHPGAVGVIALTQEGKLLLVEQYRKPIERTLIEIPAGKIDEGETLERCALRELEEETGYRAASVQHVQSFVTSPGFADEVIHIYVATDVERVDDPLRADEDEFVTLHEVTIEEACRFMEEGRIYDAKTIFALLYVQRHFPYT